MILGGQVPPSPPGTDNSPRPAPPSPGVAVVVLHPPPRCPAPAEIAAHVLGLAYLVATRRRTAAAAGPAVC